MRTLTHEFTKPVIYSLCGRPALALAETNRRLLRSVLGLRNCCKAFRTFSSKSGLVLQLVKSISFGSFPSGLLSGANSVRGPSNPLVMGTYESSSKPRSYS